MSGSPPGRRERQAQDLLAGHRPGHPLILPNAWDAASARAFAAAGAVAIATTSSAMAAVLGYADREGTPPAEMFAAVARVARAVEVPVTADLETGYGLPAAELVERLLEAGAVGCNLEDSDHGAGGLIDPERQADRLAAVRAAAESAEVHVVLNARIDVHLRQVGAPDERLGLAVTRARRYLAAGADCVYPIFVADEATIRGLTERVGGPVNILARPGAPSLARLAALGVARVSFGGGLWGRSHQVTEALAAALGAGRDPELAAD